MKRLRPISVSKSPSSSPAVPQMAPLSVERLLVLPSAPSSPSKPPKRLSSLRQVQTPKTRVLDFDIETRLVGFYQAGKFKPQGCEPIAIGCSWYGEDEIHSVLLGESERIPPMLEWFLEFYNEATMVTGHYITKFDLPILNGACLEWGMPPMSEKLAQDTKTGLIKFEGMSKSQENLSEMLRVEYPKFHMSDADWRRATRLTPGGQQRERARVEADVLQHKKMRQTLLERDMLGPPRIWSP